MDQALESQWIAGAGQLGAEFFNGIDPQLSPAPPIGASSMCLRLVTPMEPRRPRRGRSLNRLQLVL